MTAYFSDNKPLPDHAKRSLRGGAASVLTRAATAAIQILSVLFLARLLTPRDYGLVSMVTAFIGFAPLLTDLGIQDALTQRRQITHGEVSALFWITATVGSSFALVAAITGPFIARFYGEPRLTTIVLVSSLSFVACSITVQHSALMRRALLFRQLGTIEIAANALSAGGAIAVAFLGYGYWALVVRQVGTPFAFAAGIWLTCRWVPGRPTLTQGVKDALKFGVNITGYGLVEFAGRSSDRIVIGSRTGAVVLGQYQNAVLAFENVGNILVAPLHSVAVAGLSKIRGNLGNLRDAWAKALSAVTFFAMPTFGMLAATGQDLIVVLIGVKWTFAGHLLSLLAFRGIPQSVERTAGWLHVTAGRTDRLIRYGIISTCVQLAALLAALPYGPSGIVIAYVIAMFVLFIPALTYAGRPLDIHTSDVVTAVWRPLIASLSSAGLGFAIRSTLLAEAQPIVRVALVALVYASSYLVIVTGILRLRAPIRTALLLFERPEPLQSAPSS